MMSPFTGSGGRARLLGTGIRWGFGFGRIGVLGAGPIAKGRHRHIKARFELQGIEPAAQGLAEQGEAVFQPDSLAGEGGAQVSFPGFSGLDLFRGALKRNITQVVRTGFDKTEGPFGELGGLDLHGDFRGQDMSGGGYGPEKRSLLDRLIVGHWCTRLGLETTNADGLEVAVRAVKLGKCYEGGLDKPGFFTDSDQGDGGDGDSGASRVVQHLDFPAGGLGRRFSKDALAPKGGIEGFEGQFESKEARTEAAHFGKRKGTEVPNGDQWGAPKESHLLDTPVDHAQIVDERIQAVVVTGFEDGVVFGDALPTGDFDAHGTALDGIAKDPPEATGRGKGIQKSGGIRTVTAPLGAKPGQDNLKGAAGRDGPSVIWRQFVGQGSSLERQTSWAPARGRNPVFP